MRGRWKQENLTNRTTRATPMEDGAAWEHAREKVNRTQKRKQKKYSREETGRERRYREKKRTQTRSTGQVQYQLSTHCLLQATELLL